MPTRNRWNNTMRHARLLALALLACAWLPAFAATPQATADTAPPSEVARISWLAGQVSVLPAGDSQWQVVDINRPLTSGDELATDSGARVELQFGNAMAHLAGDTDFSLLALGQYQTQLALTRGTAELNVVAVPDGEYFEIDTPQVAVVIDRAARVRVDLGEGGASTVTVRRGTVVVHGDHGAQQVLHAGERYRFASPVLVDAVSLTLGSGDAFGGWSRARELADRGSTSGRYVAEGTVGYRDLDQYGQWETAPDYGEVWYPRGVATNWVPYRNGRWVWIQPWGMTWVSNEPWGFAPFHYGRWAVIGGRWGWVPGVRTVRAVYAPALVTFFGGNGWNVSVGLTIGGGSLVGWYPLAPGMIYDPWYAVNWGYYQRINRWHYRSHHWRHQRHEQRVRESWNAWRKPERLRPVRFLDRAPHGITIVKRDALERSHNVRSARVHVAASRLGKAPVRYRGLDVKPHDARVAKWQPGRKAIRTGEPVVALHLPRSDAGRALATHEPTQPRRTAPVRLLTPGTHTWNRHVPRPLSPRMSGERVRGAAIAPVRPRTADSRITRTAPHASTPRKASPVRRDVPQNIASLPRVSRLELSPDTHVRDETSDLPRVTRLQRLQRAPEPAPDDDRFAQSERRAWQPRPSVTRRMNAPERHISMPRPESRSISVPRPESRPISVPRPESRPISRPEPVRRSAPVRFDTSSAAPPRRSAPVHSTSRSSSHRTRSVKHDTTRNSTPPPIRWSHL